MKIKGIIDEDFVNYKLPSMFIIMPYCSMKCGEMNCQNSSLAREPVQDVGAKELIQRFIENPISEAVVFGGLEPFDSAEDLQTFITEFRNCSDAHIVIYTGYTLEEVQDNFSWIYLYENIVIKYGRYIPNQKPHYDEVLGVELISDNQYARAYNKTYEF